jgi:hypothetical protein
VLHLQCGQCQSKLRTGLVTCESLHHVHKFPKYLLKEVGSWEPKSWSKVKGAHDLCTSLPLTMLVRFMQPVMSKIGVRFDKVDMDFTR